MLRKLVHLISGQPNGPKFSRDLHINELWVHVKTINPEPPRQTVLMDKWMACVGLSCPRTLARLFNVVHYWSANNCKSPSLTNYIALLTRPKAANYALFALAKYLEHSQNDTYPFVAPILRDKEFIIPDNENDQKAGFRIGIAKLRQYEIARQNLVSYNITRYIFEDSVDLGNLSESRGVNIRHTRIWLQRSHYPGTYWEKSQALYND
jgi:hypothetical protein